MELVPSPGGDSSVNHDPSPEVQGIFVLNPSDDKVLNGKYPHPQIATRNSTEIKLEEIATPPDGGWGWMVVLGSFLSNFMVDGIIFSYGLKTEVILESFKDTGQESVTITDIGWIISLLHGFYGIGGPLAAALANRYGFRTVSIIGSIMASFGFGLTYLLCRSKPNLYALLLINAIIGGTGSSLMYVPSIIAVGFYFEKHRGLATGICVCGSGLGQTVFGTVVYYLIVYFGWRVSLVVEAGLFLSVCIFASLYRPLLPKSVPSQAIVTPKLNASGVVAAEKIVDRIFSVKSITSFVVPSFRVVDIKSTEDGRSWNSKKSASVGTSLTPGGRKRQIHIRHSILTLDELSGFRQLHSASDVNTINSPLFRDDILYPASLLRIPEYAETVGSGLLSTEEWCVVVTDGRRVAAEDTKETLKGNCTQSLRKLFSVEILTSYSFILITFSAVLTAMALLIPYTYLEGIAVQNSQRKSDTSVFFTVMGASSTVSRIICGIIADMPKVNPAILLAVPLAVGGAATVLLPFCTNYWLFIAFSLAFGFMAAFSGLLLPIIIVDLLSLEHLTNAFGYLFLFTGLATIFGAPFAGFLKNHTGSFHTSFIVAGAVLLLSSVLLFPIGHVNRWERRRKKEASKSSPIIDKAVLDGHAHANQKPQAK